MEAVIEAFLVQVFAQCFSQALVLVLQDLPTIAAAVRTANTSTLTDAPPPPADVTSAVMQEIANAQR